MSVSFDISSSSGSYKVEVAAGLYRRFLGEAKNAVAICDERFASDLVAAGVKAIPLHADEATKNLSAIPDVITALRQAGATRDTLLLAVGGGVVQDVAAFCAAIYMRGLTWVYVPTTLLGMADSCIGGKSSINVGEYKNIVGTFNPPQRVLIDPTLAASLSAEQKAAGLIEAAKICYCRDAATWGQYRACEATVASTPDLLARVIGISLAAKKWFIETDEFDRKERLLLNFGHTFGHALEGASDFRVSHGIAVGIGMLCALALGRRQGIDYAAHARVAQMEAHTAELLAAVPDLAAALHGVTATTLFDRFKADKKHKADSYRLVIVNAVGDAELIAMPKNDASREAIAGAMDDVLSELKSKKAAA